MATGQRVEHAAGWDVSPTLSRVFFHPDYTVGPGVSPDHVVHSEPLAGYTADRELETALLTLPRRISLLPTLYAGPGKCLSVEGRNIQFLISLLGLLLR